MRETTSRQLCLNSRPHSSRRVQAPRHGRDDNRKRERSFSGLRPEKAGFCLAAKKGRGVGECVIKIGSDWPQIELKNKKI